MPQTLAAAIASSVSLPVCSWKREASPVRLFFLAVHANYVNLFVRKANRELTETADVGSSHVWHVQSLLNYKIN